MDNMVADIQNFYPGRCLIRVVVVKKEEEAGNSQGIKNSKL